MNIIRANGIPIWVTLFALLGGVMGTFLGASSLLDPTSAMGFVEGATELATTWAGRNLGLGFAMLIAVLMRNSAGYAVAFSGAIWREISDLMAGAASGAGINYAFLGFLVVELICLAIAIRATLQQRQ